MLFDTTKVGVTGFEPATLRPPDVYATGLRHTPNSIKLETVTPRLREACIQMQIKQVQKKFQTKTFIYFIGKYRRIRFEW